MVVRFGGELLLATTTDDFRCQSNFVGHGASVGIFIAKEVGLVEDGATGARNNFRASHHPPRLYSSVASDLRSVHFCVPWRTVWTRRNGIAQHILDEQPEQPRYQQTAGPT